jgi:hypothetical protein
MCGYANVRIKLMCKSADFRCANELLFHNSHICTSTHLHINKKAFPYKQDGFYILIKNYRYNFPAIASLTKSLATICSLNE